MALSFFIEEESFIDYYALARLQGLVEDSPSVSQSFYHLLSLRLRRRRPTRTFSISVTTPYRSFTLKVT
jgi:hypothetical protein